MSKPQSPCLNCENRQINCHSGCKQYKQFRYKVDMYNKEVNKQRQFDNDYYSYKESRLNEYRY